MFDWMRLSIRRKVLCPAAACGHWGSPVFGMDGKACAECGGRLPDLGHPSKKPSVLAVAGTPQCGKTTWLAQACEVMQRGPENWRIRCSGSSESWESLRKAAYLGKPPPSTPALPGTAWQLARVKERHLDHVFIHDTAGAEWADTQRLARYRAFQRLDGLVLVMDPFALPGLSRQYGSFVRDLRPPVMVAREPFGDAHLSNLFQVLELFGCEVRNVSVAVVVTKLDVMGLSLKFESAQNATLASGTGNCKRLLMEWGMANTIRLLENRFCRVAFFASFPSTKGIFSAANPINWSLGADIHSHPRDF